MTKPTAESLPSLGRIVYYCDDHMGDEQAAIVTLVADPIVHLTIFPSNQPPVLARAVHFNATDKPVKGTWRWPPRAP